MQLNLKYGVSFIAFAALSGCGALGGHAETPGTQVAQSTPVSEPVAIPAITESRLPGDMAQYDEVGQAGWGGEGQPGYGADHPTLAVPSYAEITRLDTGKTILVRIGNRGAGGAGPLIALAPDAARALGLPEGGQTPVRVRKVNPPEQERVALRAGQPPASRLDTPEPLLVALRRKLNASAPPVAVDTPPVAAPAKMAKPAPKPRNTPKPAPVATTNADKPGANYPETTANDPAPPVKSAPVAKPAKPAKPAAAPKPAAAAPKAAKPEPVQAVATPGGRFTVQIGAFSSKANADAAARRAGGYVEAAGNLYRVRTGPYATSSQASAALGRAKAKGYRDATIVR